MKTLFILLVAYGLCFGLQNKATFLHRGKFLKSMMGCVYCTGFHSGWITWLGFYFLGMETKLPTWKVPVMALVWALASSAFCYLLDTFAQWAESQKR